MGHNLAYALPRIIAGEHWRRKDWRGWVTRIADKVMYFWPSDTVTVWWPTPADLTALDWERTSSAQTLDKS